MADDTALCLEYSALDTVVTGMVWLFKLVFLSSYGVSWRLYNRALNWTYELQNSI